VSKGSDLGLTLGTGKWELPMPTVVVIDRNHVVRFADVHPDWMVRTEADVVIDAVVSCLDLR
jgi:peroxiredoxin